MRCAEGGKVGVVEGGAVEVIESSLSRGTSAGWEDGVCGEGEEESEGDGMVDVTRALAISGPNAPIPPTFSAIISSSAIPLEGIEGCRLLRFSVISITSSPSLVNCRSSFLSAEGRVCCILGDKG